MDTPPADQPRTVRIGVDVGGTFTDLVALDEATGQLTIVKIPSTPPEFHRAVVDAIARATPSPGTPGEGRGEGDFELPTDAGSRNHPHPNPLPEYRERGPERVVVHGSTVATNALLQRCGEPVAFVTTEGFRDMLLIGRQNRPNLYALHVVRPAPITSEANWFTVRERIGARGDIVIPLDHGDLARLVRDIQRHNLRHAAVCLLFSFVNPVHERQIGAALEAAGITVSLSCDVLPEFREYERASTTAITASLRPTVAEYLRKLEEQLGVESWDLGVNSPQAGFTTSNPPLPTHNPQLPTCHSLRIMHSGGGTLSPADAAKSAGKLVLSGPAGGVIGAAFVAASAGFQDVITYDMGGTSTDVAVVLDGQPQWSTSGVVDGLPIGLPAFDIHTVGAGGGSIAFVDTGGALRVGPRSAGAVPGPACYGRGGHDPTVTDANVVLGRMPADSPLGGGLSIEIDRAVKSIQPVAGRIGKSVTDAALGIVKIAEANMASAVRAVTSRRGHDPRRFALVSFGGAGGLHACAIADALEIPRVLIPPHAGVLSALGMVVARPVADASVTVIHLADRFDDAMLAGQLASLDAMPAGQMSEAETTEHFADVRFAGQSYEVKVPVTEPTIAAVTKNFHEAYAALYGSLPQNRRPEIVTLRVRRTGRGVDFALPPITPAPGESRPVPLVDPTGSTVTATAVTRAGLLAPGPSPGPLLLIDPTATAYVPAGWTATAGGDGTVVAVRTAAD
jgi:N-methylhydantoinase A